jgi:hypothetical protein
MKIAMYDLEGHLLEVFDVTTYKELEDELKLPKASMHSCLNNRQHQVNNRQFKELKGSRVALKKIGDIHMNVNGSKEYKVVLKKYKKKTISAYNSLIDAALKNNVDQSSLSLCLTGKTKTCGGFEWEYVN